MRLQDIVRDQTFQLSDSMSLVDAKYRNFLSEKAAAEERLKRTSTEISKYRALETERRRLVQQADEKISEVQLALEEIDRQRQLLVDKFLEKKSEKEQADTLLKETRAEYERAQLSIREATEFRDTASLTLSSIEEERNRVQSQLRETVRRCLDSYLEDTSKRILQTFAGEEDRLRREAAAEAFRAARHNDMLIADLCDQRDQYRELLRLATVPGVKDALTVQLAKVEDALEQKYPGALSVSEPVPQTMVVEEIYYQARPSGGIDIILPISRNAWRAIGDGDSGIEATSALRLMWGMVHGLSLKPEEGEFRLEENWCIFSGPAHSCDDMIILEKFSVPLPKSGMLTFRLTAMPPEVQEALPYEANAH